MPRTILIVDDNPLTRKTLCEFFRTEADYEVCAEAKNGQEAIDLALKHRPELVILDLSMPVMSGVAASRELKRIMPTVPIILFSQHASLGKQLLEAALMADRIVSKSAAQTLMKNVKSLIPV